MRTATRLGALLLPLACFACLSNPFGTDGGEKGDARLRPIPPLEPVAGAVAGAVALGIGSPRDGIIYAPPSYDAAVPTALAVLFHGAGADAASMLATHQEYADSTGVLLLAIDSRAYTWDAIIARFDYDVAFIDSALTEVVRRYNVDRRRIGAVGFSDGATYALALGRANGDIFRKVVAHSPGLLLPVRNAGRASFYVAHGVEDPILPFGITKEIIVPSLRIYGFPVTFESFEGGHVMRRANILASLNWLAEP
jgi:predicted esterase